MHPYDNPYNNRTTIDDSIELFSRQKLIWRIYSAIVSHQSVAIFGLPQIGKTYILKSLSSQIVQQWFEQQSIQNFKKHIFVYIDLELCLQKPPEEVFEIFNKHIAEQSQEQLKLTYNAGIGEKGFTKILDHICTQKFHLVLLMDMFDEIVKKNKQIYEILASLRGHATTGKVSYVIASIAPLPDICRRDIAGSPFHNIFVHYPLSVLTYEEARQLIRIPAERVGMPFTSTEVEWVLKMAGRHPFLIQRVCYFLFEKKLSQSTSPIDRRDVRKQAYEDLKSLFQDTWEYLTESDITLLQDEAQQEENGDRELPELSESAIFRQFVRYTRRARVFKMTPEELENALDNIDDAGALGETNLRLMNLVTKHITEGMVTSPREKGMIIRAILNEAFEKLRGPTIRSDSDPAWQNYNILYYRFFKYHLKNEQIAARIGISVRQYFRYRRKAIEALLNVLFEMENASGTDE